MVKIKLSKEQIQDICDQYQAGDSGLVLARQYRVHPTAIYYHLRIAGIQRRSPRESHPGLPFKKAAFDALNEEAAYWIGFLMADGCIVYQKQSSPSLVLNLGKADKDHLIRFRSFLESEHAIVETPNSFRLSVKSQHLADKLASFGIVPRKTKTAQVIGLETNRHFWRGVIDGDGHVGCRDIPELGLTGSRYLLKQFAAFVKLHCPSCQAHVLPDNRPNKSSYRFRLVGIYARTILTILYTEATIALPRKQRRAILA